VCSSDLVTSAGVVTTGNTAGDIGLQIDIPVVALDPTPEVVTITYQARVRAGVPAGATLTNTGGLEYDTLPGPGGRALGDSDRAEVETPPPIPPPLGVAAPSVFDLFSFNGFQNFSRDSDRTETGEIFERLFRPEPPLLTMDPQYSGTGEPGANVTVRVFDRSGAQVGTRTVVVDTGGNWQVTLPSASAEDSPEDQWFRRWNQSRLFRASQGLFDGSTLLGIQDRHDSVTIGTVITDQHHSVSVDEIRPIFHVTGENGQNNRTYFAPPINHSHYVAEPLSIERVMEERAGAATEQQGTAAEKPLSGGWNKFHHEFLVSSGTPNSS